MERKHTGPRENKHFKITKDGVYSCTLHDIPIKYLYRRELRRHFYFVHRADDSDRLIEHGIDPQRIEELCKDCKGTTYEYGITREDYWSFYVKNDKTEDDFE